jgi:hypothetical protein
VTSLAALAHLHGAAAEGPAGTGKTETVIGLPYPALSKLLYVCVG